MAIPSDILVRFGADIDPLKKGAKSAAKSLEEVRKATNIAAKAALGLGAAAATAGVAMVKAGIESTKELRNLANAAGMTVNEFHKYSIAAKSAGIEQDKFADILKDTQDKIGDFIQTGAGPMADFFENIGPKVGVTVEQFKKLNGRDALQLYVDSLEKANVNQQEMVFYMEAIASDATNLLPLLKDNGNEFERLAENAEDAGLALSNIDAEKVNQVNAALAQSKQTSIAFTQQLAVQFAPVLQGLTELWEDNSSAIGDVDTAAERVFELTIKGASMSADALRGIQVVVKGLEVGFHGFSVVVNEILAAIPESIDRFVIGPAVSSINELIRGMNAIPGIDMELLAVGPNKFSEILRGAAEQAKQNFANSKAEMHELAMQPLPSEGIEQWVEMVKAKSQEAAEEAAKAREAAGLAIPTIDSSTDEDPEVIRAREVNEKKAEAYLSFLTKRKDAEERSKNFLKNMDAQDMKERLSNTSTGLSALSGLMETENKKMFKIGQAAAITQTGIDTVSSAQAAYKSLAGIPIVGPALGAAAAAAATLTGLQRVRSIKSTSFGSSPSSTSDTASSNTASTASAASTAAAAENKTLTLEGFDPKSLYQGDQVMGIIEALRDAQNNGYEVVIS